MRHGIADYPASAHGFIWDVVLLKSFDPLCRCPDKLLSKGFDTSNFGCGLYSLHWSLVPYTSFLLDLSSVGNDGMQCASTNDVVPGDFTDLSGCMLHSHGILKSL